MCIYIYIHIYIYIKSRPYVLLQAQKLHVYGSGTSGAFWHGENPQD